MSAGGLARIGVRCADASTGMATIGVFCGDIAELDTRLPGGAGKSRRYIPGITGNRKLAMMEDEDIVVILQAILSRRKH